MAMSKDVANLVKQAEAQGWVVTLSKGNHIKWTSPSGASVFTASTPSDWRVLCNIKRDLRKYGFIEIKRTTRRKSNQ